MPRKSQKEIAVESIVVQTLQRLMYCSNIEEEDNAWDECFDDLAVVFSRRYAADFIHGSVVKSPAWSSRVLPYLDEARFRQMVRVNWFQFHMIVEEIKDCPLFRSKLQFPVEKQLMIVLYRLGCSGEGATVAKIANLFGVGDGGTIEIVTKRVFQAILSKQHKFLSWPGKAERDAIVSDTLHELPHCVGYLDGTEIPLAEKPLIHPDDYYSRKQRFSIKAQIVCDPKKIVRNLNVGLPGSVHDARMFSLSSFGRKPEAFLSGPQWIAGDSAYKLAKTLITPFKCTSRTPLSEPQTLFNKYFSKYRVRVEHCFGELKERFNSLKEMKTRISGEESVQFVSKWVTVCVILHNLLKTLGDDDPFDETNFEVDSDGDTRIMDSDEHYQQLDNEGILKRQAILELIL